jgi:hypothetical protein
MLRANQGKLGVRAWLGPVKTSKTYFATLPIRTARRDLISEFQQTETNRTLQQGNDSHRPFGAVCLWRVEGQTAVVVRVSGDLAQFVLSSAVGPAVGS